MKYLFIPLKVKKELLKLRWSNPLSAKGDGRVSSKTLENALQFKRNGSLAKMLRAAALQRGGLIYTGQVPAGFVPAVDTEFDHAKGITIQTFGNAARVTISKTTAVIEFAGLSPIRIEGVTNLNWSQLLYGIQQIVNQLNA